MIAIVGLLTAVSLFAIALLHVYWALGGRWGSAVTVPTQNQEALFEPSTFATLLVATLLIVAGSIVLGRAGFFGGTLPRWPFAVGSWALSVVFLARVIGDFRWCGLFKQATTSDFAQWDTWLFVPLCAALAAGSAIVASGGK